MPLLPIRAVPERFYIVSEQQEETVTQETKTESNAPKAPEGFVSKADLDRALSDLHKFKNKANEVEGKLKSFEEKALAEKEDWKSLAERHKAEAEEANQKAARIQDSFLSREKNAAVKEAALKLGMTSIGDLDLLSLDGVVIETTSTGKINVLGAEAFVQNLKASKPHWFGTAGVTNVNPGVPGVRGEGKALTDSDILKLSLIINNGY